MKILCTAFPDVCALPFSRLLISVFCTCFQILGLPDFSTSIQMLYSTVFKTENAIQLFIGKESTMYDNEERIIYCYYNRVLNETVLRFHCCLVSNSKYKA